MEQDLATAHRGLAEHLRQLRAQRGLTLQDLAARSGISRATLSRIENAEVSPTAETLGRLATSFGRPISQLLAPMETEAVALLRHEQQQVWVDHETGFTRRAVSPPGGELTIEVIEGRIEPRRRIAYEKPAFPGHEHHLVLLSGALALTIDGTRHDLRPGDCLRYRLRGASLFETGDEPARYLIAMT